MGNRNSQPQLTKPSKSWMGDAPYEKSSWSYPPSSISKLLSKINKDEIKEVVEFDPSSHTIVSVYDLVQGQKRAINELDTQLKQRGWCFVDYSEPPVEKAPEYYSEWTYKSPIPSLGFVNDITQFFERDEAKKKEYLNSQGDGYSNNADHKESIHLVTGYWQIKKEESFDRPLIEITHLLDALVTELFSSFFVNLLGVDKPTFAHRADLPIAFGEQRGMLDIAHYYNKKINQANPSWGKNTEEVNCVPHFDPGLFSLSFLSTNEGLQLFDFATNTWFAGPINSKPGQENLGVLWLGDDAVFVSKGRWKPAIHRVVYPRTDGSRITAWYEVCTVEQINNSNTEGAQEYSSSSKPLTLSNVDGSDKLTGGGTKKEDFVRIERHFGIPMSKVMKASDSFTASSSADRKY